MAAGRYGIYIVFLAIIGLPPLLRLISQYHSSIWWDKHGRDPYTEEDYGGKKRDKLKKTS